MCVRARCPSLALKTLIRTLHINIQLCTCNIILLRVILHVTGLRHDTAVLTSPSCAAAARTTITRYYYGRNNMKYYNLRARTAFNRDRPMYSSLLFFRSSPTVFARRNLFISSRSRATTEHCFIIMKYYPNFIVLSFDNVGRGGGRTKIAISRRVPIAAGGMS